MQQIAPRNPNATELFQSDSFSMGQLIPKKEDREAVERGMKIFQAKQPLECEKFIDERRDQFQTMQRVNKQYQQAETRISENQQRIETASNTVDLKTNELSTLREEKNTLDSNYKKDSDDLQQQIAQQDIRLAESRSLISNPFSWDVGMRYFKMIPAVGIGVMGYLSNTDELQEQCMSENASVMGCASTVCTVANAAILGLTALTTYGFYKASQNRKEILETKQSLEQNLNTLDADFQTENTKLMNKQKEASDSLDQANEQIKTSRNQVEEGRVEQRQLQDEINQVQRKVLGEVYNDNIKQAKTGLKQLEKEEVKNSEAFSNFVEKSVVTNVKTVVNSIFASFGQIFNKKELQPIGNGESSSAASQIEPSSEEMAAIEN